MEFFVKSTLTVANLEDIFTNILNNIVMKVVFRFGSKHTLVVVYLAKATATAIWGKNWNTAAKVLTMHEVLIHN